MNINEHNELKKRKFRTLLIETQQITEKTVDSRMKSIYRFDDFLNGKDYKVFNSQLASAFKKRLMNWQYRGNTINAKTIYQTLKDVKEFMLWLSEQPGYKSRIKKDDIQHLNPPGEVVNKARNQAPRVYPTTLLYVKKLVMGIDDSTEIGRRDRALISLLICTGMRSEALSTLPIGCVDLKMMAIDQNPDKGVRTKRSKRIFTCILPVDSIFMAEIKSWYKFLIEQDVASNHPLFPKSEITHEQGTFSFLNNSISDKYLQTPNRISCILKKHCEELGLKYYSAHSLRHLHEQVVEKAAKTPRDIKLLSQNMGHAHVATTLFCYGYISEQQQVEELKMLSFGGIE